MAERVSSPPSLGVAAEQPLIGLVLEVDGRQVVRYVADEVAAVGRAANVLRSWSFRFG